MLRSKHSYYKHILLYLSSVLLLSTLTACFKISNYNHHLQTKAPGSLRLASYNVNWGNGVRPTRQPEKTLKAIIDTQADIMLLQETTRYWEQQVRQSKLSKIYPHIEFRHYPNAGGFAILAKYPFTTKHYHYPGIGWHPFWIINAKTNLGDIELVNTHLTPPLVSEGNMGFLFSAVFKSQGIRKREMQYIRRYLHTNKPTIIAGDFNEGDIGGAVIYLRKEGFIDALKKNNFKHITWEWQVGPFNFNDRFDRIFYTPSLKLINLQVLHQGSSDHYPIIGDFVKN